MKRTKKTASKFRRQRAHEKSQDYIERMYAEDGLVISVAKDGSKKTHTVAEAAAKGEAINDQMVQIACLLRDPAKASKSLENQLRRGQTFLTELMAVMREAQKQKEDPTKKTNLLQNFVEGRDVDGQKLGLGDEDERTQRLLIQLHSLDEQDIRAVLRSKQYTPEQQEAILVRMHSSNLATAARFGDNDFIL